MEMAETVEVGDSEDSSDSDVAVVLPQKPKRRRILPGTAPMVSTVYSNKVNSSLKLLPYDVSTVAVMEKELQKKQGCEDLSNETIEAPLPVKVPALQPVVSDTEDVDSQQPEVAHERIRNSSPSPPPSPSTPVIKGRKGALTSKIRKMEACLQDLGTVLSPKRNHLYEDNDVIMVEASTVPEVTIKVRRRGKIFRINIRMDSGGAPEPGPSCNRCNPGSSHENISISIFTQTIGASLILMIG